MFAELSRWKYLLKLSQTDDLEWKMLKLAENSSSVAWIEKSLN